MNDNDNRSDELQKAWTWVGIGITVLILLATVNGPIFIDRLISALPTPQFQEDSVFNAAPLSNESVQVEIEPTIEEEVFYEYEYIGDYVLEDLSGYNFDDEMLQGSTLLDLTASFSEYQNVFWGWQWCTSDATTLFENFSKIQINAFFNNADINSLLIESDYSDSDSYCRLVEFSDYDWSVGQHTLRIEIEFTDAINDGLSDDVYPAATHVRNYQVTVTE